MKQEHLEHLKVYTFDKKLRLGIERDGGYVVADLSGGYDCYISCGVGRFKKRKRNERRKK